MKVLPSALTPKPPMVPETCVPCSPHASGLGSGAGSGEPLVPFESYSSPTRSVPPTTFAVGNSGVGFDRSTEAYASLVPGPPKSACV